MIFLSSLSSSSSWWSVSFSMTAQKLNYLHNTERQNSTILVVLVRVMIIILFLNSEDSAILCLLLQILFSMTVLRTRVMIIDMLVKSRRPRLWRDHHEKWSDGEAGPVFDHSNDHNGMKQNNNGRTRKLGVRLMVVRASAIKAASVVAFIFILNCHSKSTRHLLRHWNGKSFITASPWLVSPDTYNKWLVSFAIS